RSTVCREGRCRARSRCGAAPERLRELTFCILVSNESLRYGVWNNCVLGYLDPLSVSTSRSFRVYHGFAQLLLLAIAQWCRSWNVVCAAAEPSKVDATTVLAENRIDQNR